MQDSGLVSIITPTFNCGHLIAETIRSVQAQTYTRWEMIIVDDCSSDNTRDIVTQFKDDRIKYHCLEHNSGAAVARNTALKMAQGRWIAFLDSDDLWMPEKLEHQLEFMVNNSYIFSYHNYTECDENGKQKPIRISGPKKINKLEMFAFCWPGCLTVMYEANKIGVIQIEDIKKNNDYAMWLKVSRFANCYLLNEELAIYRRGRSGSISNHSYMSLIKWHYRLFRDAEHYNALSSIFLTAVNLICGFYKKIKYVSKI